MESANIHFERGVTLWRDGDLAQSAEAFQRAVQLRPDFADAHNNLGNVLLHLGRLPESVQALQRAVSLRPEYAEAHNNLGNALCAMERFAEGAAAYRKALSFRPNWPDVQGNLSIALRNGGDLDASIAMAQAALANRPLGPLDADRLDDLGNSHKEIGQIPEALDCYRRAAELGSRTAHSNRLFLLQYDPNQDAASILREHQLWNARYAAPLASSILPHANDRSQTRRLRIGYVSPDFRLHCQSLFTTPLLSHHNHQRFEIYCYSSVAKPDAITQRLRNLPDVWRDVGAMSDAALAELIRGDRIDVLVDLTMHMSSGRPLLFARKPAPVQITWLAYPGTTGLAAMDYRLTDPHLDPPGTSDQFYSERSIRLADTFWCYDPHGLSAAGESLPEVAPPPVKANGFVTFGCLNNFCKINDRVLNLWGKVLAAVAHSQLLLLAPSGLCRQRIQDALGHHGISAQRVQFVGRQPRPKYLAEFHQIDLCLDTLPYNGHTTSLDSYWMGVPVITRVGLTVVGRAGCSQLSNLGLTELAAADDDQFVKIASQAAADSDRLTELRRTLRQRLMASPLGDARRFAASIDAAYEFAWHNWCGE